MIKVNFNIYSTTLTAILNGKYDLIEKYILWRVSQYNISARTERIVRMAGHQLIRT